jgi:hypothetical protein
MDQYLSGLGVVYLSLVAGACFLVMFLCLCVISRQLSYMLWAISLAGVAISLLWMPQMVVSIFAVGTAVASLLVLVSGIRAKRERTALQLEFNKLNDAVAALQSRFILGLSKLGPPPTSRPAEVGSPASTPLEPDPLAEHPAPPSWNGPGIRGFLEPSDPSQ